MVVDAGFASSCLQKLPVLSSVVDVASGAAEVLGLDWTSSSGEMSSNRCFLKVDWGLGILQWFETAAKNGQLIRFLEEEGENLVSVLRLKIFVALARELSPLFS